MSNSKDTIRVGICGAGSIVNNHCLAIERVPGVQVVAVSSRTARSARKIARKYKIERAFNDHRKVIESPDVDVVLVATPNYLHSDLSIWALEEKKHVLVEKPLAMNPAEGKKMVAAEKKSGMKLMYAEQLPLAPKFKRLIEMAKEGHFGDVYMVRQIERHAGPYSPWFFDSRYAGGGAMADLGCHSISVVRQVFEGRKIERVTGLQRTFRHTQGDVEDFMLLQIFYEGGPIGVVESNWCHLGGMDSITEVFGSRGNGYGDLLKGSGLEIYTDKPDGRSRGADYGWQKPPCDDIYEFGYQAQIEAMKQAVTKNEPGIMTGHDGLDILKIMDAGYRSAKNNSRATALNR